MIDSVNQLLSLYSSLSTLYCVNLNIIEILILIETIYSTRTPDCFKALSRTAEQIGLSGADSQCSLPIFRTGLREKKDLRERIKSLEGIDDKAVWY